MNENSWPQLLLSTHPLKHHVETEYLHILNALASLPLNLDLNLQTIGCRREHKVARVFVGYRSILLPRRSAVQIVIALLNLLSAWGTLYLLLRAAGLNTNIWLVAGFIPLLQLVNSLPFLYMGWGGREIAMAATLGAASNLTINETLAVSIAWGVVLIMTGAINGIFLLGEWQRARKPSTEPRERAGQVE